jgi:hypothetical protein
MCRKKDPPIDTVLVVGVNISERRMKHSDFNCNDCSNERQRRYKDEKYAEYREQQHQEAIEQLAAQWNDPAYKDVKEIGDRVYKVWNKYDRRLPENGIRRDWACEVVFPELWFIDTNGIVEAYFAEQNISKITQYSIKNHLIQFVSSRLDHERLYFREKARNRWNGIVDAITKKYHGKDKLVATPKYVDPVTKEFVPNWYLLSREVERKEREEIRDAKIERLTAVTEEEKAMIMLREETIRREKAQHKEQNNKDLNEDNKDFNEGDE